jgi:hypothetical protein
VTDEEHRASGDWAQDPFIIGIREGVAAGYQAVEYVLEGAGESVRRRARSGWTPPAGTEVPPPAPSSRPAASLSVDELVTTFAKLLDRAGEVAREAAHHIGERDHAPGEPEPPAGLVLRGIPGASATIEFRVSNTGATALSRVTLIATHLVSDAGEIPADAVNFIPPRIDSIRPGGMATAEIVVAIPATTPPGAFRGLVHARPGDAWTVLELTVAPRKAAAPPSAVYAEAREEVHKEVSA